MAKSKMPSSLKKSELHPRGFMTSLASAVMEWILMLLLFANAVLSYLIMEFARYCNLPLPCVLCSRLDNLLGKKKVELFQDLFCRNHKSEISSLVLCHAHCKLVDVHKMCETCLFSFATINKSNSETYRLLVGKLGDDPDCECERERGSLFEGKKLVNSLRRCCCCNELWHPKSYPHELLRTCSIDHNASHLDRELPPDIGHDSFLHKQRSRKEAELRDESHMYHVGYTELKVTSDTESEVMISEYESNILHYEINDHKTDEYISRTITLADGFAAEKLINPSSDHEPSVLAKPPQPFASTMALYSNLSMHGLDELNWHPVEPLAPSTSPAELISFDDLPSQYALETAVKDAKESDDSAESSEVKRASVSSDGDNAESSEVKRASVSSDGDNGESSEVKPAPVSSDGDNGESSEVKRAPVSSDGDNAESSEVKQAYVSSDGDNAESSEFRQTSIADDDNAESSEVKPTYIASDGDNAESSEFRQTSIADDDNAESSEVKPTYIASDDDNAERTEVKQTSIVRDDDSAKSSGVKQMSLENAEEGPKEMMEAVSDSQPKLKNDTDLQSSKSLDFGDAYNIAISNKGRLISSGSFGERTINNSAKISEDLKQLLSQISRGSDLPSFDMSPRVSRNLEELKHLDSSSAGLQMLQKRTSLERNMSGLESLDGSVSEVEGESSVDRLKRQIEHDKKLLLTLYKELEEERNASAVAANQAMAMITRLQEEKAALHMDASQYLRMLEEQAEYDMEALQNCNDLLSEREIEIQALEAELEHYRSKYPDEAALLAKSAFSYDSMENDSKGDRSEARSFEDRSYSRNFSTPRNVECLRTSFRDQMKSSFLERENERSFVSDLSSKLKGLSENEVDIAVVKDDQSVHREDTELRVEYISHDEELADGLELENSSLSNQKEGSLSNGILDAEENIKSDEDSSEKHVSGLDVNHDAIVTEKSSPNSPENHHRGWHIVQEIDLEEDKGKAAEC